MALLKLEEAEQYTIGWNILVTHTVNLPRACSLELKPGFYSFLLVILSASHLTYLSLNYTSHQKGVVINKYKFPQVKVRTE